MLGLQWQEVAPWGIFILSALGSFAQFKIGQWRLDALEKWKNERESGIADYHRWRGSVDEKLRVLEERGHEHGSR